MPKAKKRKRSILAPILALLLVLALAEKLGYGFSHGYVAYEITAE